jgi:hypothetical protein
MKGALKIRYQVTLATEVFHGPYHKGDGKRDYDIAVPISIYGSPGSLYWKQLGDNNNFDPRIPTFGTVRNLNETSLTLMAGDERTIVAVLEEMPECILADLQVDQTGKINHVYSNNRLKDRVIPQPYSTIKSVLKGKWTVMANTFKYGLNESLHTGWTFNTSNCTGFAVGAGVAWGGLKLNDPYGKVAAFKLLGGGAGLDPSKVIKAASKAVTLIAKALGKAGTFGASNSTEDMWSKGFVFKNPLWSAGRNRAMTKADFEGLALWAEANVVAAIGGGVQLFFAGVTYDGQFKSLIPMAGQQKGLNIGAGAFLCNMVDANIYG